MKKQDVINFFGGKSVNVADAIGRSRQCVAYWKEDLTKSQCEAVIAAAVRLGMPLQILLNRKQDKLEVVKNILESAERYERDEIYKNLLLIIRRELGADKYQEFINKQLGAAQ